MPKRKVRLTPQRKRRAPASNELVLGDPSRPSAEEWETMQLYRSFMVKDEVGELHQFPSGKYALIVPADVLPNASIELHEYWVGKMKEIRSRGGNHTEVWVKVQWLWSAKDISIQKKKFDTEQFGYMERFISNAFDYVHTSCFQAIADVVKYNESNLQQKAVSDGSFYYRYEYDYMTATVIPKPNPTCVCDDLYDPDDEGSMHFCPRRTCQRSFHVSCLKKGRWTERGQHLGRRKRVFQSVYTVPRCVQLRRTLPDSVVEETQTPSNIDMFIDGSIDEIDLFALQPPKKKRGRPPKKSLKAVDSDNGVTTRTTFHRLELIPTPLLHLAQSPMVKGQKTSLPRESGVVVGNVPFVARARELVSNVLIKCEDLSSEWETLLQLPSEGEKTKVEAWVAPDEDLVCPSCGGAI